MCPRSRNFLIFCDMVNIDRTEVRLIALKFRLRILYQFEDRSVQIGESPEPDRPHILYDGP